MSSKKTDIMNPELYAFLEHYVKICQELEYYKKKCLTKNAGKNDHKKETILPIRKHVTKKVKEWAIQTRVKELGLSPKIYTWLELLKHDPCVSNESEFYKSYLEEYNNRIVKLNN